MGNDTTIIDVIAQVTDNTAAGVNSAVSNLSRLEQTAQRLQGDMDKMRKQSKVELTFSAIDKASKVLNGVLTAGKGIAGKVWTVTLKAVDFVTAPFRGIAKMLMNPMVAMASIAGLSFGVADTINTYKTFEQGMANVKAIIQGTDSEMARLTQTAKDLGESTMFTASQASEAMQFLAMAGWKTNEIIAGMPGLLSLAAAGGVDLATAGDVVSGALAQFGMKASEAARVADVLAAAATNSKTDVTGLGESLKYAGTLAGTLGYSIEDTALALGLLGNVNIQGSQAGTALRGILSRMGGIDEDMLDEDKGAVAQAMNELGMSMTDPEGKAKSLTQVMLDLRDAFRTATAEGKNTTALAKTMAGQYGMTGLLAIANSTEEAFWQLSDAINNSTGTAAQMATTRMDTIEGSMYYLSSAAEGVKIAFMERLAPYLKSFIDWLTGTMPGIKEGALSLADSVTRGIDRVRTVISDMIGSTAWQDATTVWDKFKVAWDRLIAEPFSEWWNGSGKAWLAGVAQNIGSGLGSAIRGGLSAIFGIDADGAIEDGKNIGVSFSRGFKKSFEGMDWGSVAKGFADALAGALKIAFSNPVTGAIAGTWLTSNVLGGVSTAYKGIQGIKQLYSGATTAIDGVAGSSGGLLSSVLQGLTINRAAAGGGAAAQSALTYAQGGQLGIGTQIGATGIAGTLGSAAGVVTAGVTLLSAAGDLIKAVRSDDKKEAGASYASAFTKAGGVGIGAAIGSAILPGIGTAIGAGIGGLAGYFAGNSIMAGQRSGKAAEEAATAEAARRSLIEREQAKYSSPEMQKAILELSNGSISEEGFLSQKQAVIARRVREDMGGIELSMTEISSLAEGITFGDLQEGLDVFAEASSKSAESLSWLVNSANKLSRLNWKADAGIIFDENEFKSGIEEYIASARSYLDNRQYEITSASKLLLGKDADLSSLNAVFANIKGDVEELSSQLTAKFTVEGELDTESIADLQRQIAERMNTIAGAGYEASLNMLKVKYGGENLSGDSILQLQSELGKTSQTAKDGIEQAYTSAFQGLELQVAEGAFGAEGKASEGYKASFSAIEEAYKQEISGVDQRISDFLLEEVGNKFDLSADQLASGLQQSLLEGIQPFDWTAEDINRFLGLQSFEDGATMALAQIMGNLAAILPEMYTLTPASTSGAGTGKSGTFDLGAASANIAGGWGVSAAHASGGIFNKPHLGMVAEAGAEAIIPLSGDMRHRGMALWERAGEMLGAGSNTEPLIGNGNAEGSGAVVAVPVNIGNISLDVKIDGESASDPAAIVEALRSNIHNLTDDIARNLAAQLQMVFANMPSDN